jgi:hypothetical protein
MHDATGWNIRPSFTFDTLCLLNVLTGDPFYVRYYAQDYEAFQQRFTPEVITALKSLKVKMRDEGQQIISALLCMYFSATHDQTLDDILTTLDDSREMQQTLKQSQYYKEESWNLYESVRPELISIIRFLQAIDFNGYWHDSILPRLEQRIQDLRGELGHFNVVAEDEALLGFPLPSDELTVYILYYTQPHGMKILGTRFITDASYPLAIVVRNAVHEMFHPPYDRQSPRIQDCTASLRKDPFLKQTFDQRNPDYGYNTFEGLIEEDCVRALEQIVNERLGIVQLEARERWTQEDEGLHVFAACIYMLMKEEQYNARGEVFEDFLTRMVQSKLKPGLLEQVYTTFMDQ